MDRDVNVGPVGPKLTSSVISDVKPIIYIYMVGNQDTECLTILQDKVLHHRKIIKNKTETLWMSPSLFQPAARRKCWCCLGIRLQHLPGACRLSTTPRPRRLKSQLRKPPTSSTVEKCMHTSNGITPQTLCHYRKALRWCKWLNQRMHTQPSFVVRPMANLSLYLTFWRIPTGASLTTS